MKEYLLYLLGELTEYRSEQYPNSRFWKNDEYGVVLEFKKSGNLYIYYPIWGTFSMFFSLEYDDTQKVMKSVLEEHLKLGLITPLWVFNSNGQKLEEHLKLAVITPTQMFDARQHRLDEHLKLRL